MRFKYPGGEVAFWTILWIIGGSITAFFAFQDGKTGFGLFYSAIVISSILLWFGVVWAKWPIIIFNAVVVYGGALILLRKGFNLPTLGKVCIAVYLVYFFFRWKGRLAPEKTLHDTASDNEEHESDGGIPACEPINIFSCKIDPRGVVQLLRSMSPDAKVIGPDDDWQSVIVPYAGTQGAASQQLQFDHHSDYYDNPKWPMQVLGMQGYFSNFPEVARKADVLKAIGNFRFALSLVENGDLDIDSEDGRLSLVYAVCKHLDGIIFTPSSLRDASGRILLSAGGSSDPLAVLPAMPKMVQSPEPEEDDAEEVDFEPDPPSVERVAARALALAAVAERGLLENEAVGIDEPDQARQRLLQWVEAVGIGDELEPEEWKVLQRRVGTLDRQSVINAVWRIEGLAIILWAVQRYESPDYDKLVKPLDLFDTVGILDADASRSFLAAARLRPEDELEAMRKQMLAFHWRLRNFSLRPQAMDFVAFSQNCWFGSFDIGPFRIRNGDLAIGSHAIKDTPPSEVGTALSIANERHKAINWLRGYSKIYSETDTST